MLQRAVGGGIERQRPGSVDAAGGGGGILHWKRPKTVLADAGYCNEAELDKLETHGVDACVAMSREGRRAVEVSAEKHPAKARMAQKLATEAAGRGTPSASGCRRRRSDGSRRRWVPGFSACGS